MLHSLLTYRTQYISQRGWLFKLMCLEKFYFFLNHGMRPKKKKKIKFLWCNKTNTAVVKYFHSKVADLDYISNMLVNWKACGCFVIKARPLQTGREKGCMIQDESPLTFNNRMNQKRSDPTELFNNEQFLGFALSNYTLITEFTVKTIYWSED